MTVWKQSNPAEDSAEQTKEAHIGGGGQRGAARVRQVGVRMLAFMNEKGSHWRVFSRNHDRP